MTDIENAWFKSPCCKGEGTRKDEYDKMDVKIPDDELGEYESTLPVFTCKGCGKKYVIERVVTKSDNKPATA